MRGKPDTHWRGLALIGSLGTPFYRGIREMERGPSDKWPGCDKVHSKVKV